MGEANCHRHFKPGLVFLLLTKHYSQLPRGSGFIFDDSKLIEENEVIMKDL